MAQQRAGRRKQEALTAGHYQPLPNDLWRRLVPLARKYDKGYADIATLYTYLLAHVNGQHGTAQYMSAWPSVQTIAADTGIGRNRVPKLAAVLEAVGLLEVAYEQRGVRRLKRYYPLYYSTLSDAEVHANLKVMHSAVRTDALHSADRCTLECT